MASFVNACVFTANSGGTGTFTVSSAVTGWLTPAQAGAVGGASYRYRAYSSDLSQWEVGTGTYTSSGATLTRAPLYSSNANALVSFTAPPSVALTVFAADLITFTDPITPAANDGAALGTTSLQWSDLFLASGGVINFDNGDVTITEGTNTLAFAGASSGYSFDATISIPSLNGGPLGGFRNKIINGDFDIWQWGISQTSSGYGSDDRWLNLNVGSTKTHIRGTLGVGIAPFLNYSLTTVSSVAGAGNYVSKMQRIEGVHTCAGKKVTLTFYAGSDQPGKFIAVELHQNFGTGGSPSTSVTGIGTQKIALGQSLVNGKISVTIDVPSIAGKTLGTNNDDSLNVVFWFDAGSGFDSRTGSLGHQSGAFYISHVSLVEGDATAEADPFSPRHIQQELTLCQRYYEKTSSREIGGTGYAGTAGNDLYAPVKFTVPKRGAPTIVLTQSAANNVNTFAVALPTTAGFYIAANMIAVGYAFWLGSYTADAEL